MQKKRTGPIPVAPVSSKGIRYEALHWGKSKGLDQNGGYIAAVEEKSGRELWLIKVYDVLYDKSLEGDKQDVFITQLLSGSLSGQLIVKDERGGSYAVDLGSRAVVSLPRTD